MAPSFPDDALEGVEIPVWTSMAALQMTRHRPSEGLSCPLAVASEIREARETWHGDSSTANVAMSAASGGQFHPSKSPDGFDATRFAAEETPPTASFAVGAFLPAPQWDGDRPVGLGTLSRGG